MSLTATTILTITAKLLGAASLGTSIYQIAEDIALDLADGTGDGQADQAWGDSRALAASTSENLDLHGMLVNELGQTVNFARAKLVFVRVTTDDAGTLLYFGGAASDAWEGWTPVAGSKITARGGGFILLYAPDAVAYPVTAATGDVLKIDNPGGADVEYDILVIGATA